jgi:hypothetical protein
MPRAHHLVACALSAFCWLSAPVRADSATCGPDDLRHGLPKLPPLHQLSAAALDSVLASLATAVPRFEDRLRALALARLGAPYVLGCLGEGMPEDPDPVFRVDQVDCTVLVLTSAAMAQSKGLAEAEQWMGPANYRRSDGGTCPVSYANRLHFTEDRLDASLFFADVTRALAAPSEIREVEVVLNRQASGEPLLPIGWERPIRVAYVPADKLPTVLARAPDLLGLAFVRESYRAKGLLVAHEGLLFDRQCLLHASTESRAAVLTDFADYFFRPRDPDPARVGRPRFDGAILYAVHEIGAVGVAGAGGAPGGGGAGDTGSGQAGSAGTPGR